MKAAIYIAAGKPLVIEERPDPTPGNGQVVINYGQLWQSLPQEV